MKSLFLFSIASLFFAVSAANAAGGISCQANYRAFDSNNRVIEKSQALVVVPVAPKMFRHEANLEGRNFSVTEEIDSGDLLLQITVAPEYTKGLVSRARPDSTGRVALADVDGDILYKLECFKNK